MDEQPGSVEALLAQATQEAADRLRVLASQTTDKETRKAARRALYLLSQKGIAPAPVTISSPPSVLTPRANDRLRAYASAYDGAGNRMLCLIWPDPDGGSPTFLQILLNDQEGVRDIERRRVARPELATLLEGFAVQLEEGIAIAEIDPEEGRFLLAQARELAQQKRLRTPPGFLDLLRLIGPPSPTYTPVSIWESLPAAEIQNDPDLPRDPADLFRLPWFEPWFLDVADVMPWLQSLYDLRKRTDIAEEAQRRQLDETAKEIATALLQGEPTERYVRRLETSADILRRRERKTEARQALLQALNLREAATPADSPFAVLLVQRTLQVAIEMQPN